MVPGGHRGIHRARTIGSASAEPSPADNQRTRGSRPNQLSCRFAYCLVRRAVSSIASSSDSSPPGEAAASRYPWPLIGTDRRMAASSSRRTCPAAHRRANSAAARSSMRRIEHVARPFQAQRLTGPVYGSPGERLLPPPISARSRARRTRAGSERRYGPPTRDRAGQALDQRHKALGLELAREGARTSGDHGLSGVVVRRQRGESRAPSRDDEREPAARRDLRDEPAGAVDPIGHRERLVRVDEVNE
jgi:hypothetical protein